MDKWIRTRMFIYEYIAYDIEEIQMTQQLIDKLRQRIERDAKKCSDAYFNGEGFMGLDSVQSVDESFTAGASSLLPLVEMLVVKLKEECFCTGELNWETRDKILCEACECLAELEKYAAEGEG